MQILKHLTYLNEACVDFRCTYVNRENLFDQYYVQQNYTHHSFYTTYNTTYTIGINLEHLGSLNSFLFCSLLAQY